MKRTVDFLRLLHDRNEREWFNAHKALYKAANEEFVQFIGEVLDGLSSFDETLQGLQPKECIYRIYRDTRFSNDKTPYKTHFGAFIVSHGKKSGNAGYYIHIEPTEDGLLGCSMLASGLITPEPPILRSIREEILDCGDEIEDIVARSDGYRFSLDNSLKRTPQGFPAGTKHDRLLRMKDHFIWRPLTTEEILHEDFARRCVESFRTTKPYLDHLNRAIEYAREEMM